MTEIAIPEIAVEPSAQSKRLVRRLVGPALLMLVLTVFALWARNVVPYWRYQINPDGVSYITIAQEYRGGHFYSAINAYWSPLYSWLIIPFLAGGAAPLLATKLLAVAIGAAGLIIIWRLLARVKMSDDLRMWAGLTAVPMLLYFGMQVTTPDLLVAVACLLYLLQVTEPNYESRPYAPALTGLLAVLAYFAKAYALAFVLAHWGMLILLQLWRVRRDEGEYRRVLVRSAIGLCVFGVLAGSWMGMLRYKYGYWTIGSTGTFNRIYNGLQYKPPMGGAYGLLPPPSETAISMWEDVTPVIGRMPDWSPWNSPAEYKHQLDLIGRNLTASEKIAESFTGFWQGILLAGIVLAASRADPRPRRPALALAAALVLYPTGYYFVHTETRFYFLVALLLLIIAAYAVHLIAAALKLGPVRRGIVMLIVCASFAHDPAWRVFYPGSPPDYSMLYARGDRKWPARPVLDKPTQDFADQLVGIMPPRSRVAANADWTPTLYASFNLDLRFYGISLDSTADAEILRQLREFDIQYWWVWSGRGRRSFPFTKNWPEITAAKVPNLRIYRVMPQETKAPADLPTTAPASAPTTREAR